MLPLGIRNCFNNSRLDNRPNLETTNFEDAKKRFRCKAVRISSLENIIAMKTTNEFYIGPGQSSWYLKPNTCNLSLFNVQNPFQTDP